MTVTYIAYEPSCQFTDSPALSFPGKLTQFLYRRFELFGTQKGKGFVILPCELIDNNGDELKSCVLHYARQWNLPNEFIDWVNEENIFCNTLVDRIVTGYPANEAECLNKENGYEDLAMTAGEPFCFWAIEGPDWLRQELPFASINLPVIITIDIHPYKQRKVRILNGAHTSMVLGAYLSGKQIVREYMQDKEIMEFLKKLIYSEIISTLSLPKDELETFASSVIDRFNNPFIDHALLSIALNSTSKWKARILPTLKDYIKIYHTLPEFMVASFANYLAFYRNGMELTSEGLNAVTPDGRKYIIKDDSEVLRFFYTHRNTPISDLVHAVCEREDFWGERLSEIPGFEEKVIENMRLL